MKPHILRLTPGQDLRSELENFVKRNNIAAGCVLSCVGSLEKAKLRLADLRIDTLHGPFEIVSLMGTLSEEDAHLHISMADKQGQVFGGHLKEGTIVHTTVELIIGELKGYRFLRKHDERTGFDELDFQKTNLNTD